MPRLTSEPSTPIRTMDELMALAYAMEKESADRYAALAVRMREAGRQDLAAVFDRLVREETGHMDMVVGWSQQALHHAPPADEHAPKGVFDDEGAALVSPELQDAYHSFAMAVRNEERAFAFWSYVAADAPTTEIREAAERMAHEELEHARILRRERRKAFFAQRAHEPVLSDARSLGAIENDVAAALEQLAESASGRTRQDFRMLAAEARRMAQDLETDPLDELPQPAPRPCLRWRRYANGWRNSMSRRERDPAFAGRAPPRAGAGDRRHQAPRSRAASRGRRLLIPHSDRRGRRNFRPCPALNGIRGWRYFHA